MSGAGGKDRIFYRDVEMIRGWPERIREAQRRTHYAMGGRRYPRIPYGRERLPWDASKRGCADCAVLEGEFHVPGCDHEECPRCRGQAIGCDCPDGEEE